MICVIGAGGTVGNELTKLLELAKASFRVAHFSKEKAEISHRRGLDAAIVDYNRPETLRTAFHRCNKLFLLGPNVPSQTELELNAVEVAMAVGVRRIVKLSVLGADKEVFALAKVHRVVERAIESSGVAWTFLRPNSFMQNVVTYMGQTIRSESAFYSASGEARISHIDVRDVAEVAVKALTETAHEGKAYTLTGPEALSYDELAIELSRNLGRQISHVNLSPSELRSSMLAENISERIVDRMLDLERYYCDGHGSLITGGIKKVTGHDPRRFATYARDCAHLLQSV